METVDSLNVNRTGFTTGHWAAADMHTKYPGDSAARRLIESIRRGRNRSNGSAFPFKDSDDRQKQLQKYPEVLSNLGIERWTAFTFRSWRVFTSLTRRTVDSPTGRMPRWT